APLRARLQARQRTRLARKPRRRARDGRQGRLEVGPRLAVLGDEVPMGGGRPRQGPARPHRRLRGEDHAPARTARRPVDRVDRIFGAEMRMAPPAIVDRMSIDYLMWNAYVDGRLSPLAEPIRLPKRELDELASLSERFARLLERTIDLVLR